MVGSYAIYFQVLGMQKQTKKQTKPNTDSALQISLSFSNSINKSEINVSYILIKSRKNWELGLLKINEAIN